MMAVSVEWACVLLSAVACLVIKNEPLFWLKSKNYMVASRILNLVCE